MNQADKKYMHHALNLAQKAEGHTSPNPLVGAVIVRDGRIVGKGYHRAAGTAHAEVHALAAAGERAQGATVYVTLEPCSHHGRTPPCAEALIRAGVRRVVVAMGDPNPLVAGRGIALLKEAGIEVEVGLLADEARSINRPFIKYITTGRPLVAAKMAVSIDGKIATRTGSSQWITGEEARQAGRRLRHLYDAILVGSGTVLADNPRLTTRLEGTLNPLRVVLDSRLRLPLRSSVLDTAAAPTLVVTTAGCDRRKEEQLRALGVEVLKQPGSGQVELPPLLEELGSRGITGLLVEGGAAIHGSFFDQGLVDVIHLFLAPKVIGGQAAPGPVGGSGIAEIQEAAGYILKESRHYGSDLGLLYEKEGGS